MWPLKAARKMSFSPKVLANIQNNVTLFVSQVAPDIIQHAIELIFHPLETGTMIIIFSCKCTFWCIW